MTKELIDILESTPTVIPECIYRESRPIFYKYYKKRISLQTKIQTHSLRVTGKGGRPLRNKIQIRSLRETVGGMYNSEVQYFCISPEKSPSFHALILK